MKTLIDKIHNVQQTIGKVKKDKSNPFFKSNYADINDFLEALLPLLKKEGLTVMQPLCSIDGVNGIKPGIKTIITDGDNQLSEFTVLPDIQDPQKAGSSITYFRRFALQSFFCLVAYDDDAETAMGRTDKKQDKFTI
jgi:hypothetical protein